MKMRFALAATLVGASLFAVDAFAQATTAPPMQTILAGKKFQAPVKGQADVDYTKPQTTRKGNLVITKIQVKNASSAPIGRLRILETWFDANGATIPGGEGLINGLLQPGEVQTIEIQTPFNAGMKSNSWNFLHANGNVKPHLVKSLDGAGDEKEPAAKKATAKKK